MAKRKGKGHKALERAVKGALDTKRDKLRLVPALMGAYVNGQKTLQVAGRPDFVWVRLRGATSEVAQAFNDVVGEHWDLPILIKRDEMAHDRWRVHARDIRAYADWGGASYTPPHAESHSFGDPNQTGGIDPVWIFKRQFMPLLPRPTVSGSMAIYLEPDFYYFEGEYHWWPGSGTTSLGGYLPTGAFNARFVTVYLDGSLRIPQFLAGPEFDFVSYGPWGVATDPGTYISLPDSSQGIPIAAVRLYTGSTTIGWGDIYDLRSPQQPLEVTGWAFAEIYAYDVNDTIAIAGAGKANRAQITSFNANGVSNNMTPDHTNDHITVTKAGMYLCTASITIESTGAGGADTIGISLYKNNGATEYPNVHAHRRLAGGGGDVGSASLSGIVDLAVNDTIELWTWNEDGADDVVVDDVTLSLVQIGGT